MWGQVHFVASHQPSQEKEKQPLFLLGEQGIRRLPAPSPADVEVLASCFSEGVRPHKLECRRR